MDASQAQDIIDELKMRNPEVTPAALRKAVEFSVRMFSESGGQDAGGAGEVALMFAHAQAYLDGYAAAIDGDFDVDDVEPNPDAIAIPEVARTAAFYSATLPGHVIARATHYTAVLAAGQPGEVSSAFGSEAIPAVAFGGFANGLERGILDGSAAKYARRVHPAPDADAVSGAVAAAMARAGFRTPGEGMLAEAMGRGCMEFLSRKVQTRSGSSRFDADGAGACAAAYCSAFTAGAIRACFSDELPGPDAPAAPRGLAGCAAEVRAWCRARGYPEGAAALSVGAAADVAGMSGDGNGGAGPDGLAAVYGMGFADGLASVFVFERPGAELARAVGDALAE